VKGSFYWSKGDEVSFESTEDSDSVTMDDDNDITLAIGSKNTKTIKNINVRPLFSHHIVAESIFNLVARS